MNMLGESLCRIRVTEIVFTIHDKTFVYKLYNVPTVVSRIYRLQFFAIDQRRSVYNFYKRL